MSEQVTRTDRLGVAAAGGDETAQTLRSVAHGTADDVRHYLGAVSGVADGSSPESALSILLLAVSNILGTGARLGAMVDVVPRERFEPDTGPEVDVDPVRSGLSEMLGALDEYYDVIDPVISAEVEPGSLTNDLMVIASCLDQGLRHFDTGQIEEALWWWQFSYLSLWGDRAASALRVIQSILSHVRLDAEEDVVAEAEFDALHG